MYVHYTQQCLQSPEEGVRSLKTGVTDSRVDAGNHTYVLWKNDQSPSLWRHLSSLKICNGEPVKCEGGSVALEMT